MTLGSVGFLVKRFRCLATYGPPQHTTLRFRCLVGYAALLVAYPRWTRVTV